MENQLSMLPQPTARPSGGVMRALGDLSESDNNARNGMPPPASASSSGLKRQGSNLPEPAQKRKTLVERAGEPVRPSSTASIARPPSATSQYASSNTSHYRSSSNTSTLSRTNSASSRNTSASSYTGSLNSGIRPPTMGAGSNTVRPKSSYAKDMIFGTGSRPNASLANLQASHEAHAKSKKSLPNLRGHRTLDINVDNIMPPPSKPSSMLDLKNVKIRRMPSVITNMRNRHREVSLSTQLNQLHLHDAQAEPVTPPDSPTRGKSPSKIPRASPAPPKTPIRKPMPDDTPRLRHKSTIKQGNFLTLSTNIESFDPDVPYQDWKRMFDDSRQMFEEAVNKMATAREETNTYKEHLTHVEQERHSQTESLILVKAENRSLECKLSSLEKSIAHLKQDHEQKLEELKQLHRHNVEDMRREQRDGLEQLKNDHREALKIMRQRHEQDLDQERSQRLEALSQISTQGTLEKQRQHMELERKDQEIASVKLNVQRLEAALEREEGMSKELRETLRSAGEAASGMEATKQGLQAKIAYLESDSKSQSEAYAAMEKRMNEAIALSETIQVKWRKEEAIRRKLHNQVQELRGNIRVFCRVRPTLAVDEELAKMKFPDEHDEATEIEVKGLDEKNSLGKDVTKTHPFAFDKVFSPSHSNDNIYEEIENLITSALDGFNVCIFAYGQTGSGKTYTMSSADGMIPRALRQIYEKSKDLEALGWTFHMQGSFVEVYNEEIRDLLGDDSYQKHEIQHDLQIHETIITNATILDLDDKDQVESILSQAMTRRSVAATRANEHSSRSHSVFILKLRGKNNLTGEESKGTLNLVDLAGSERIKNAETSGQRLKETQSINKSLSCLGDVIGALGQGPVTDGRSSMVNNRESLSTAHIPYRNSKLTYLLQLSLGGNCKTLMFVMVAPEKKCLSETITSLKFAEKVSKTKVGVAKRSK